MKMEYRPYRAKSMINKLRRVDDWLWADYTLNPYRGCAHLCVYCDARANQYGLSETFDQIVYYKENAVEILKRQLPKLKRGIISTGGVCDAYQPIEAELCITRRILKTLAEYEYPVEIMTKSDLVLRDLDVLQEISRDAWAGVLFTITTFNAALTCLFEPFSPSPERRIAALEKVARYGLTTGVMLCPSLPGITDDEAHIEEVVRRAREAGAQFVLYGGLTLKEGPQRERFIEALRRHYPEHVSRYEELYSEGYSPKRDYSRQVGSISREICRCHNMPYRMPRPIMRGDRLAVNKRIAEDLFARTYEMELDGDPEHRIWAYRKAAWAVDELGLNIADIYRRDGIEGLTALPSIGAGIARVIRSLLEQKALL